MEELLAGYAVGTLPRPFHALVGAHLELSSRHHRYIAELEGAKGADLCEAEPVGFAGQDAMLAAILSQAGPLPVERARPAIVGDSLLPPSLRTYLGLDLADIHWRFRLPGVKECIIESRDGVTASMLWVKAGRRMPQHTHDGLEATLLLQGGFRDDGSHFRRGDVSIGEHDVDHQPVADADIDCICFAVIEGETRLTGPMGRMLRGLIGR